MNFKKQRIEMFVYDNDNSSNDNITGNGSMNDQNNINGNSINEHIVHHDEQQEDITNNDDSNNINHHPKIDIHNKKYLSYTGNRHTRVGEQYQCINLPNLIIE